MAGAGLGLLTGCRDAQLDRVDRNDHVDHGDQATRRERVQTLLQTAVAAARRGDRPGWEACLSRRDGRFAARADQWFAAIHHLPWQDLRWTAATQTALPAERRSVLGSGAWLSAVEIAWRLIGDPAGVARQRCWITVQEIDGTLRLASGDDRPDEEVSRTIPLWLQERTRVTRNGSIVLLSGGARDGGRWPPRLSRAVAQVRAEVPAALTPGWSGGLVVQLPSSRQAFERVLGVADGSYAGIAAVAWPMGPDVRTAPVQLVVNPVVAATLDETGLGILLAHEVTHVATRSPASAAPTWLVEGFADAIAYRGFPQSQSAAARALLAQVRRQGAPTVLPADRDFEMVGSELDLAYARAWTACRYAAETFGPERLARLYAAAGRGDALRAAIPATLGVSEPAFVRGWATDLRRQARAAG